MQRKVFSAKRLLAILLWLSSGVATAEPYLAVQQGFPCMQCHVNPTGGGQRNLYGNTYAQTILPARHLETGDSIWTGELNAFLSIGGNIRASARASSTPDTRTANSFDLDQARLYFTAAVVPQRLLAYVDEQMGPGGALNREAYGLYWSETHAWYVKAGQLYLPFGLRLEDQTAFIRQVSGINMTTPDRGVEFGWSASKWEAQLAVSNGTAGAAEVDNGKQYSAQGFFIRPGWRLGLAANFNDAAAGSRTAAGIFGGLRTGPIAWLGEVDWVKDKSPSTNGRTLGAALIEANYTVKKGQNLKLTYEYYEPNRDVANDAQTRLSVAYELTPIQFLQLRLIARFNDGIPQVDVQHQRLYLLQAHAFF